MAVLVVLAVSLSRRESSAPVAPVEAVAVVEASAPVAAPAPVQQAQLTAQATTSAWRLRRFFKKAGYDLEAIRDGEADVPPLFAETVPGDLGRLADSEVRKVMFQQIMLPLVLAVNQEITDERTRLVAVLEKRRQGPLSAEDRAWLADLADRYDVDRRHLDQLLTRVDALPPSLALAQAAVETGWGTSQLVVRTKNLFGHTASASTMRRFDTLQDAVRAYALNLNTHPTYAGFRQARAKARKAGAPLDGHLLAGTLIRYSERGESYVDAVRSIIQRNDLTQLDQARLKSAESDGRINVAQGG